MKIKIFNCAGAEENVEKEVNTFIEGKEVIDMKFNTINTDFDNWGFLIVMYEDKPGLSNNPDVQWFRDTRRRWRAGLKDERSN